MYVRPNFKSKAALKRAITNGDTVTVFSPGPYPPKSDGTESVEGPHAPEPHTWYATVTVKDGRVVSVK